MYTVLFFVSEDCPLCKAYQPTIQNLNRILNADTWNVAIIRPDLPSNNGFNMGVFGKETGDSSGELSKLLGATVTPEVIILNSQSSVLYRGAIDNYSSETGKHRTKASKQYLMNAIREITANGRTTIKFNTPVGCYIE